jgi:hypothetical protein
MAQIGVRKKAPQFHRLTVCGTTDALPAPEVFSNAARCSSGVGCSDIAAAKAGWTRGMTT